ncbi:hypothetical protein ACERZ8_13070 [Tateyamaria armeniaca]|uniref:Major facilitator superfamily (MFS) profile domain-containing protein n=1 Tax=Tateyamaria armeniaca TaxID=2518930 RepID=A0ABW8UV41_9RHOB
MQFLTYAPRLRCAALTAMAGGAVAQTMSLWGGHLARFLPPMAVMMGAGAVGAGIAGLILADAFGRAGRRGAFCALLGWPIATLLGAVIGATLVVIEAMELSAATLAHAVSEGAPFGIMALMDGISTSPAVAGIWLLSGWAMHVGARVERRATI